MLNIKLNWLYVVVVVLKARHLVLKHMKANILIAIIILLQSTKNFMDVFMKIRNLFYSQLFINTNNLVFVWKQSDLKCTMNNCIVMSWDQIWKFSSSSFFLGVVVVVWLESCLVSVGKTVKISENKIGLLGKNCKIVKLSKWFDSNNNCSGKTFYYFAIIFIIFKLLWKASSVD